MTQPAYKSRENVYCVAGCRQIVKSDGVDVCEYATLTHRTEPKTACICRRCQYNARKMQAITGQNGLWKTTENN